MGARVPPATLRRIRAHGTEVRVSIRGDGPVLQPFMGIGAPLELWEPFEREIARYGRRLVAIDLPGTGGSAAVRRRCGCAAWSRSPSRCSTSWASIRWTCSGCRTAGRSPRSSRTEHLPGPGASCWRPPPPGCSASPRGRGSSSTSRHRCATGVATTRDASWATSTAAAAGPTRGPPRAERPVRPTADRRGVPGAAPAAIGWTSSRGCHGCRCRPS